MYRFIIVDDVLNSVDVNSFEIEIDGVSMTVGLALMRIEHDRVNYTPDDPLGTKYESLYEEYKKSKAPTDVFACSCGVCEGLFYATSNTIIRRGRFICKDCSIKENHKKVSIASYKSLAELVPEVVKYWSVKNNETPENIHRSSSSKIKYYTVCPFCGNEVLKRYDAILRSGPYCGPCAKRVLVPYEKSLRAVYPVTAEKYDSSEKNKVPAASINHGSSGKAWFKCPDCSGVYYKSISNQVTADKRGAKGCPYCHGEIVQEGINDLVSKNVFASRYWANDKNSVSPKTIYYKDRGTYWFRCSEGHLFESTPFRLWRSYAENSSSGCPICSGRRFVRGVNDVRTVYTGDLSRWSEYSMIQPEDVTVGSNKDMLAICINCGNEYVTSVFNFLNGNVCFCENCRKRKYSRAEKEVADFVRELGFQVYENYKISGNTEVDIYIPSKGIALDYNGLYWHSTAIRDDIYYHKKKIDLCRSILGARLYYIWEDDYFLRKDVLIRWIMNLLGVSTDKRVDARKCVVCTIDSDYAKGFLDKYHIQGSTSKPKSIGLVYDGDIVAVLAYSFNSANYMVNIERYATNCKVRGGFSKLLKELLCSTNDCIGAYTFSDNSISDGNMYRVCGFEEKGMLKPDYTYLYKNTRCHKFNFRKKRFHDDPTLLFEEGKTERELAELNGLCRVYDAGKIRWEYMLV